MKKILKRWARGKSNDTYTYDCVPGKRRENTQTHVQQKLGGEDRAKG